MGIKWRLRAAASCLALAMFVVALTAQEASAEIIPDADLPTGACISFAETDVSQCVAGRPKDELFFLFTAVSSTHRDTITTVILPDGSGVGGSGPVQDQLNALLAGPNGASLQNLLTPVIGQSTLTFIDRQYNGTDVTIDVEDVDGPGSALVGFNRSRTFLVPFNAALTNVVTNFDRLFTDTFQATNSLSAEGLGWLSGDLHTTFQTVLLDDGFGFTDVLLSRGRRSAGPYGSIIAAADGGVPLEASLGDGWSTWSKSSYRNASFDDTSGNFGFGSNGFSSAYGLDHADGDWLWGAAAGYSKLKSKQNVTGDKGDLQAFKAGLYASYSPGDWTITGSATGSFQSIKSKRLVTLPTPAKADYDAASFNLGLEAARHIALSGNAFLEPMAGFNYSHLRTDGFTEAGGGGLGLSVDAENTDALKAYIGARLASTMDLSDGMTITPELRTRLVYDVLGDSRDLTARFVGEATPFAVSGLEPSRLGGIIGAGLTLAGTQNWQATLSYDAEIRGSDISHTLRSGFKWAF